MSYEENRDRMMNKASSLAGEAIDRGAQAADRVARTTSDLADQVSGSLKSYGVDTDQVKAIAKDQVGQLQQALADTVRSRPLGALAVAAALGVVLGVMTTR
jgi:ElaB/YqjD/DUF883 family membrane-anchored ribosome-binding protein